MSDEQSPKDNILQKSDGIVTEEFVEEPVDGISISCIPVAIAFSRAVITVVVVGGTVVVVVVVVVVDVVVVVVLVVVLVVATGFVVVDVFFFATVVVVAAVVVVVTDVDATVVVVFDCTEAFSAFATVVLVVEVEAFFFPLCFIVGVVNMAVIWVACGVGVAWEKRSSMEGTEVVETFFATSRLDGSGPQLPRTSTMTTKMAVLTVLRVFTAPLLKSFSNVSKS